MNEAHENSNRPREWPEAVYKTVVDPSEAGNPYIEALPAIWTDSEIAEGMSRLLEFDAAHRLWTPQERRVKVAQVGMTFYQPLDRDTRLLNDLVTAVRTGYLGRNPVGRSLKATLKRGIAALADPGFDPSPEGPGFGVALIGPSGVGKSTGIRIGLECFQQVIPHVRYNDRHFHVHQVVWIKVNCPEKGSLLSLCKSIIRAFDELLRETYAKKYDIGRLSQAELVPKIIHIANVHGLGLLVIDEIQWLRQATTHDRGSILNFFTGLMNGIGVPLVLVGTNSARPIIEGSFPTARRTSAFQHTFGRLELTTYFQLMLEELWTYQYLNKEVHLTHAWRDLMYFYSQGIPDIAVKLFVAAQRAALSRNIQSSTLTPELFKSVWEERFGLMHKHMAFLRKGKPLDEAEWDKDLKALHEQLDMASL